MEKHLIHIKDFCRGHEIELSFVIELQEYDLIELKSVDSDYFIELNELPKVEKMVRLHQELSINREGLEVIHHLLERTQHLNNELQMLRQRLNRYEDL